MIGAGFSKNAVHSRSRPGFPDWSQLGDRFYERLHGRKPEPDRNYLQAPALAHEIEAAFGRPALNQMLRDAIPDLQHEPSRLHVNLLDLPWSDVFTTNYDTLLERGCRSVISQRYDVVVNPEDLGHSNRPRIIKLHGSLPSDRPFIVTDEDYRRYPHDFAPFVNAVRQALLENTLCLIGFSGDDRHGREMTDGQAQDGSAGVRWQVVAGARWGCAARRGAHARSRPDGRGSHRAGRCRAA